MNGRSWAWIHLGLLLILAEWNFWKSRFFIQNFFFSYLTFIHVLFMHHAIFHKEIIFCWFEKWFQVAVSHLNLTIVWIVNKNSFHFHILTLLQYILTLVNTFWYESIYNLVQNMMNFPFLHKKQVLVKWFNDELPIDTYHF